MFPEGDPAAFVGNALGVRISKVAFKAYYLSGSLVGAFICCLFKPLLRKYPS